MLFYTPVTLESELCFSSVPPDMVALRWCILGRPITAALCIKKKYRKNITLLSSGIIRKLK